MSIIVLQHTVADNFDVDPSYTVAGSGRMLAGSLVGLNASGYVYQAGTTNAVYPLGIAGDSVSDEYKTSAFSAQLVISPTGAKRWTQDRVDNYFNETLASGKMTVYTTGGRFGTDQYVVGRTYAPGTPLYANASGLFTDAAGSTACSRTVGYVLASPGGWESGVPGADAATGWDGSSIANINGSMALGPYLFVQLSI
jgi:hypothetical protein